VTPQEMVRAFHEAFDLVIRNKPDACPVTDEEVDLRMLLTLEEVEELAQAMTDGDVVEVADALADIVYVVYGTALHYGIDLDAVVREVHRSNMSKLPPCEHCNGRGYIPRVSGTSTLHCSKCNGTGKLPPLKRLDGKVLKPETFFRPNVSRVLGVDGDSPLTEEAAEPRRGGAPLDQDLSSGFVGRGEG
jgi:NTP pyrophosphatase (non-canonical NTP hydrolase)